MSGDAVFAYGTLVFDDVMEAVTGRRFQGAPASLAGYARRRIVERSYPGIFPDPTGRTPGRLFVGVDAASLRALDVFEGDLYDRLRLPVSPEAGGGPVHAWTYVVAERFRHRLSEHTWDPDEFMLEHGEAFIADCRRAREEGVR